MVSVSERLRKAAAIRTVEVRIDDEKYTIREVSATAFGTYGALLASADDPKEPKPENRLLAVSVLLQDCVIDENELPCLSTEDAKEIAKSARVTTPLVSKIMELSGFSKKETDAS